jgi:LEA14-like dessication related protein
MEGRDLEKESVELAFARRARAKRLKVLRIMAVIVVAIIIITPILYSVQEPIVDIKGLKIEATGATISIFFIVKVQNPNIVGAKVLAIEGKAYVNGDLAGEFYRTESVEIPAGDTTEFEVRFEPKGTFTYNVIGVNKVRAVGALTIDGLVNDWEVPFDETRNV